MGRAGPPLVPWNSKDGRELPRAPAPHPRFATRVRKQPGRAAQGRPARTLACPARGVGWTGRRRPPKGPPPCPRTPSTTPATSPCWRGSRPSASGRACTSAPPIPAASCTASGRSSTTRWTRPWPASGSRSRSPCIRTAPSRSRTTGAASPWTWSRAPACPASRWCSPSSTPAASSAAVPTPPRVACTAWARRWSMPCPRAWTCRCCAAARSTRCRSGAASRAASRTGRARRRTPRSSRPRTPRRWTSSGRPSAGRPARACATGRTSRSS